MPQFSRRHYTAIADVINRLRETPQSLYSDVELLTVTRAMGELFALDNPAFKPDRFLTACGFDAAETSTNVLQFPARKDR